MSIAQAEKTVLDKIRSRGYWRVVIRPGTFNKNHIPSSADLFPIISKNSVQLRGWDYPHVDHRQAPKSGPDWVSQDCDLNGKIETWRFYQSGMFLHYFAMFDEWRDQEVDIYPGGWNQGKDFYFLPPIYSLRQIFEFGARLALSPGGADPMRVEVDIHTLQGRTLVSAEEILLKREDGYQAKLSNWNYAWKGSQTDLIARPRPLAAEAARDLFARFGLDISLEILTQIQDRISR
jgi:hypothetical protein